MIPGHVWKGRRCYILLPCIVLVQDERKGCSGFNIRKYIFNRWLHNHNHTECIHFTTWNLKRWKRSWFSMVSGLFAKEIYYMIIRRNNEDVNVWLMRDSASGSGYVRLKWLERVQTCRTGVHQDNSVVSGHDMWSRNQLFWTKRSKTWLEQHIVIWPGTVRWYWSDSAFSKTSGIWNYRLVFSTEGIWEKSKLYWAGSLKRRYKHCTTAVCVLWDVCACTLSLFNWKIDLGMIVFKLGTTN